MKVHAYCCYAAFCLDCIDSENFVFSLDTNFNLHSHSQCKHIHVCVCVYILLFLGSQMKNRPTGRHSHHPYGEHKIMMQICKQHFKVQVYECCSSSKIWVGHQIAIAIKQQQQQQQQLQQQQFIAFGHILQNQMILYICCCIY